MVMAFSRARTTPHWPHGSKPQAHGSSAVQGGTGAELLVMGGGWHTPSRWEAWDRHQAGNQKSNHLLEEESRLTEERAHWEGESWLTEKERAH